MEGSVHEVVVERISIKDMIYYRPDDFDKEIPTWPVGIRIDDLWYNTTIYGHADHFVLMGLKDQVKNQTPVLLILHNVSYTNKKMKLVNYSKWKFPNEVEILAYKLEQLTKRIVQLELKEVGK